MNGYYQKDKKQEGVDEGMEENKTLFTVGGNVICCSHYGKQFGGFSKILKIELPYDLTIFSSSSPLIAYNLGFTFTTVLKLLISLFLMSVNDVQLFSPPPLAFDTVDYSFFFNRHSSLVFQDIIIVFIYLLFH